MNFQFTCKIGLVSYHWEWRKILAIVVYVCCSLTDHELVTLVSSFNEITIQAIAQARMPLDYRESTCSNLSVSCLYKIIDYSVLKQNNAARMHTISRQFIPLIYGITILPSCCVLIWPGVI